MAALSFNEFGKPTVTLPKMGDWRPGFRVFSLNDHQALDRDYRNRRAHKKTRSGCLSCRSKRVKVCGPALRR